MEGRLAQVLAEATTLGVEMTKLGLSPVAISIQGSAPSIQVVEAFAERLRGQGWSVQSETPSTAPDGRPQFILKGMAGHEG